MLCLSVAMAIFNLALVSIFELRFGGVARSVGFVDDLGGASVRVLLGGGSGRHGASSFETKGNGGSQVGNSIFDKVFCLFFTTFLFEIRKIPAQKVGVGSVRVRLGLTLNG